MVQLPRSIQPESIRQGDTISVTLPDERGLTIIHQGTVAQIENIAGGWHFRTAEGTRIAVFVPGRANPSKYTLVKRPEHEQVELTW